MHHQDIDWIKIRPYKTSVVTESYYQMCGKKLACLVSFLNSFANKEQKLCNMHQEAKTYQFDTKTIVNKAKTCHEIAFLMTKILPHSKNTV